MHSLISGALILKDSSVTQALSAAWVSVYCWVNSSRNVVHRASMSSIVGSSSSRAAPTLFTYPATFLLCIKVRVRLIFCMADLKPGTHRFKQI